MFASNKMVWFAIVFSRRCRAVLLQLFTYTSIALCFICALLIYKSIYITVAVAPKLSSERAVVKLSFIIIGMLATQLALYYMAGIYVCYRCHTEAHKKKSGVLLKIWAFTGYTSVINMIIVAFLAPAMSNHIVRSMHYSMHRGMENYLKDLKWKLVIDQLQTGMHCCGSISYKDWYRTPWLHTSHLVSDILSYDLPVNMSGPYVLAKVTPWSCCSMDYSSQCLHDPLQQIGHAKETWSAVQSQTVYRTGCVEVLREPIENGFFMFVIIVVVILIMQVFLTILSRYIFTSFKTSVITGNFHGSTPGWIFGDPGYVQRSVESSRLSTITYTDTTDSEDTDTTADIESSEDETSSYSSTVSTTIYETDNSELQTIYDEKSSLLVSHMYK